jgi:Xaa-Pro aminopeptidase
VADPTVFPSEEFAARLERTRAAMAADDLAGLVVAAPENVFYLTGLDHQGFCALHLLVVPATGEMTLIARAMEWITVEHQVTGARFMGYADHEDPARVAGDASLVSAVVPRGALKDRVASTRAVPLPALIVPCLTINHEHSLVHTIADFVRASRPAPPPRPPSAPCRRPPRRW